MSSPIPLAALLEPYVRGLHVRAQRLCPVTACTLNVHTAVVMEHSDGRILLLLSPEGWAQRGEEILANLVAEHGDVTVKHAPQAREPELRKAA